MEKSISGGAGTLEQLYEAIAEGHADAVLIASDAHFGTYSIGPMRVYLADRGVPVRLSRNTLLPWRGSRTQTGFYEGGT